MPLADKVMLRKRFVIETVLDTLKSEMGLEHSRHRSVINAMVHVLSCLVAYAFRPGKPSISLDSTTNHGLSIAGVNSDTYRSAERGPAALGKDGFDQGPQKVGHSSRSPTRPERSRASTRRRNRHL